MVIIIGEMKTHNCLRQEKARYNSLWYNFFGISVWITLFFRAARNSNFVFAADRWV
jgi:hypothetical protein